MTAKKLRIDLSSLEPLDRLDEEEKMIHKAIKSGNFSFHGDQKTIKKYAEIFKENSKQRKAISLRIPTQDYFAIKAKATELGLPYQALINSLIHRYISGIEIRD